MPDRFDELRRYVRFSEGDLENLRLFHSVAAPHFERISRDFYERIREHAEAHAVLSGEEQINRLQRSLVKWMGRVCTAERDEAYLKETQKIGLVHVRINLPQRYVFTAMALIHIAFNEIADAELGARAAAVRASIVRALDLELALMLETYYDDLFERLKQRAAVALARSEHHFENAFEVAPYLVIGVDRNGKIALFNRAAETVTQYARDQVRGRAFIDTLLAEPIDGVEDVLAGRTATVTLRGAPLRTLAGRMRQVDWQIAHAPSDTEDVVAFAIGRDVTEELAGAERTRQQEKLAAVGTLAAGLAHEIRNPLNGAHLHVTFLDRAVRKTGGNPEMLEAVKVVGDEIKRLSTLVTEFLDFARPKPLERTPIVVQRLCEKVASFVAPTIEATHTQLTLDMPATDLVLDGDRAKLDQVLTNLVQNALEAMASGGGTATLRARRQPLHAVIEVEDEGPGLPDPTAPVFDAFYTTKQEGTGLGLAIVHRIVTDHGGTVSVDSRAGRTLFRVVLPISGG